MKLDPPVVTPLSVGVREHPRSRPSLPYDPRTETDPLIRDHITLDHATGGPVFRRFDYYVVDVLVELRATGYNFAEALISYPELTRQDLEAAQRFSEIHGEEPGGTFGEPA